MSRELASKIMIYKKCFLIQVIVCLFFSFSFSYCPLVYSDQNELLDLSVEDLLNMEVTSVAKKVQTLNNSPAAIFVITNDDIKRVGATSIPEALRLAPGVDVSRIDANKWAVSVRGFNGRFANKLLVMIDGRTTYTRAFAGVYWENQDVMLEDVDRIEVIRGPGATLWGANAVNGVINIITKHSADTQGGLFVAGAGSEERGFGAFRYGGKLNTNTTGRVYVKGFVRDENTFQSGDSAGDGWDKVQGGFRIDSKATSRDNITIQGDAYRSIINQNSVVAQVLPPYQSTFNESIKTFGGNVLLRHQHIFSSTSEYSLQFFYDYYQRDEALLQQDRHVVDLDFQHRFALYEWNDVIWGLGYRYTHDNSGTNNFVTFIPSSRNDQLFSAFIQDEITLIDDTLWFTLGSKFEHNDYSGFEIQPTARLMWAPHLKHRLWAAASRAVRTPSRLEHDVDNLMTRVVPPQSATAPAIAIFLEGNQDFGSEQVISYEVGYRTTVIDEVSIDFTAFYNDYSNLRVVEAAGTPAFNPTAGVVELPSSFFNNLSAKIYGFEIASVWQMLDWWQWNANYSFLKTHFDGQAPRSDTGRSASPQHHVSLRSKMSPWEDIDLDLFFRYVDSNKAVGFYGSTIIDEYVSLDIRVAWRPVNEIELSLVGQNLLAEHHLEYRPESFSTPTEIDRGVYAKLAWSF